MLWPFFALAVAALFSAHHLLALFDAARDRGSMPAPLLPPSGAYGIVASTDHPSRHGPRPPS